MVRRIFIIYLALIAFAVGGALLAVLSIQATAGVKADVAEFEKLRAGVGIETTAKPVSVHAVERTRRGSGSGPRSHNVKYTEFCPSYEFVDKDGNTRAVDADISCEEENKALSWFPDIPVIYDPSDSSTAFDNSQVSAKHIRNGVAQKSWMIFGGLALSVLSVGGFTWLTVNRTKRRRPSNSGERSGGPR